MLRFLLLPVKFACVISMFQSNSQELLYTISLHQSLKCEVYFRKRKKLILQVLHKGTICQKMWNGKGRMYIINGPKIFSFQLTKICDFLKNLNQVQTYIYARVYSENEKIADWLGVKFSRICLVVGGKPQSVA